jgi:hypothetical protein
MFSGSFIYLLDLGEAMEEVMGGLVNCNFLLDFHQVQKEIGKELVNWPLP